MARSPCIALLTDFGSSDAYVAATKAVIVSICPAARILDITHNVAPQNIDQGAYLLWSIYKYFPKRTIFVSVVDPGVGTTRKVLLVQSSRYSFITPDNGLLKFLLPDLSCYSVREVKNASYFREDVSSTFHGRDIFAPVAAHLAVGVTPKSLGPVVEAPLLAERFKSLAH